MGSIRGGGEREVEDEGVQDISYTQTQLNTDIDLNAAFSCAISCGFTITRRMSGPDKANHCSKPMWDLAPPPPSAPPVPPKTWLKEKAEKAQGSKQTGHGALHKMSLPPLWEL